MINYKVILNFIGFLLIIDGLAMMTGIPFSLYYGDDDVLVLLLTGSGISISGFFLYYFTKDKNKEITKREGYIVVSLGWIVMSLFGALPFIFHGSIP